MYWLIIFSEKHETTQDWFLAQFMAVSVCTSSPVNKQEHIYFTIHLAIF